MIDRARNEHTRCERIALLQLLADGENLDRTAQVLEITRRRLENHLTSLKKWNRCKTTYQLLALGITDGTLTFNHGTLKKRPYEEAQAGGGEAVPANAAVVAALE